METIKESAAEVYPDFAAQNKDKAVGSNASASQTPIGREKAKPQGGAAMKRM
jgi:hypothetical protein